MRWNTLSSTFALGLVCATVLGAGSLFLGDRTEASGPPAGINALVINSELQPVPIVGHVGVEQSGDWNVSVDGVVGIDPNRNIVGIDPSRNDVSVTNELRVEKGTRRLARFELMLERGSAGQFFDIDTSRSTKIRIAISVNASTSSRDAHITLLSKVPGEENGSILDEFVTSPSFAHNMRLYDLPGEEVRFQAIMDDDDDDAFRQVIVTVWGD